MKDDIAKEIRARVSDLNELIATAAKQELIIEFDIRETNAMGEYKPKPELHVYITQEV